jgi:hypothetical protein
MKKTIFLVLFINLMAQNTFAAEISRLGELAEKALLKNSSEYLEKTLTTLLPEEVATKIKEELVNRRLRKLREVNEALDVGDCFYLYKARISWDAWFEEHSEKIGIKRKKDWELPPRFEKLILKMKEKKHPCLDLVEFSGRLIPHLKDFARRREGMLRLRAIADDLRAQIELLSVPEGQEE